MQYVEDFVADQSGAGDRLLPLQAAMAYDHRCHPVADLYLVTVDCVIEGALDEPRLARALQLVAGRHPVLSGTVAPWAGTDVRARLPVLERVAAFKPHPPILDPLRPGPIQVQLRTFGMRNFALRFSFHHIAADRLSIEVLLDELSECYATDGVVSLAAPDYADLDARLAPSAEAAEAAFSYWRELLADAPVAPQWRWPPAVPDAPACAGHAVDRVTGRLDLASFNQLTAWAQQVQLTRQSVVLAAYAAALASVSAGADQVIGVPVSLHDLAAEGAPAIGPFMEMLPLRLRFHGDTPLAALAAVAQQQLTQAWEHRRLPFSEVVRALGLSGTGRSPLVQVIFAWGGEARSWPLGAARMRLSPPAPYPTLLDLSLLAHPADDGLWLAIDFSPDRIAGDQAQAILAGVIEVLQAWTRNPALAALAASPAARAPIVAAAAAAPARRWLHTILDRLASAPDRLALLSADASWTRRDLALMAAQVQRQLPPGCHTLALCAERGAAHVAALLAALASGRTVALLDPDESAPALERALHTIGAALVMTTAGTSGKFGPAWPQLALPARPGAQTSGPVLASHPATLVLFTSGTTGAPRAVLLSEAAVDRHAQWFAAEAGLGEHDRVLQFCSVGFDACLEEILPALGAGAAIVLRSDDAAASADAFSADCERAQVTVADLPTGYFNQIVHELAEAGREWPATLRLVVIGGEAVTAAALQAWQRLAPGAHLLNTYGPTEACVVVSGGPPPGLGSPRPGVRLYLLDPWLRPVPAGLVGELYLGGDCLAEGYAGCAGATARRFLPDPWATEGGARMYRTGDLMRRDRQGVLLFVARADRQLKVHGFRVEPAALEAAWRALPGVRQLALVVTRDGATSSLVLAAELDASLPADALLDRLRAICVPRYWPTHVVAFDSLPRTVRGKLDRPAIARCVAQRMAARLSTQAPDGGEPVHPLLELIARLAGVPKVGPDADFLSIGGHSLLALRVVGEAQRRWGLTLPASWLLGRVRFGEILDRLATGGAAAPSSAAAGAGANPDSDTALRVTPIEQAILLHEALFDGASPYVIEEGLALDHVPGDAALEQALLALVAHQPMLRAVLDGAAASHWRLLPAAQAVACGLSGGPLRPARFDLLHQPGWRLSVRRDGAWPCLWLQAHHALMDGRSIALFWRQLVALVANGQALSPRAGPPPPAAVAETAAAAWWEHALAGADARPLLPPDYPPPAGPARRALANQVEVAFDGRAIDTLVAALPVTPFCAALACAAAWLHRALGRDDLLLGLAVSTAVDPAAQGLIRAQVALLPVRSRLAGSERAADFATLCQQRLAELLAHHIVAPAVLGGLLRRAGSESGMLPILFDLDDAAAGDALPGRVISAGAVTARTAIEFSLRRHTVRGWTLVLRADAALYQRATLEAWAASWQHFVGACAEQPECPLRQLALVDPATAAASHMAARGAGPGIDIARELDELLGGDPRTPLIGDADGCWTRAALATQVAATVQALQQAGAGYRSTVGLALPRSALQMAALLAVWRIGASAVLIDPVHPPERLAALAGRVPMDALLVDGLDEARMQALAGRGRALEASTLPPCAGLPPQAPLPRLAYVAFTSGSTGTPRAVLCPWAGLAHLLQWSRRELPLTAADRFLHMAAPAFDIALWEILHPLLSGARLHILPASEHGDVGRVAALVRTCGITAAHFVPSLLAPFLEVADRAGTLRQVIAGGEALSPALFDAVRQRLGATLHHTYGPTETAIFMLCWHGAGDNPLAGRLPLGEPVDGCQVGVVDAGGTLLPRGLIGELCIAGAQVGDGYLGDPRETARRFRPAPGGARVFFSGDRVRMRADGALEYHGRRDRQVKLAGVRIELAEVEAVLQRVPGVQRAVVVVRPDPAGQPQLVAYLAASGDAAALATAADDIARDWLPVRARPRQLVVLERFALNVNGKIDMQALPEPSVRLAAAAATAAVPVGSLLEQVLAVWRDVTGRSAAGPDDDLFAAGGDSITAIRIVARLKASGQTCTLQDVFRHPSPALLARALQHAARTPAGPLPQARAGALLPPAAEGWLRLAGPNAPGGVQAGHVGLAEALDQARVEQAWRQVRQRYAALRLRVRAARGGLWQADTGAADETGPGGVVWADPAAATAELVECARRSVDLSAGRAAVLVATTGGARARLVLAVHHVAIDWGGWGLLIRALHDAYLYGALPQAPADAYARAVAALAPAGGWQPPALAQFGPRRVAAGRRQVALEFDAALVAHCRAAAASYRLPLAALLGLAAGTAFCSVFELDESAVDIEFDALAAADAGQRELGWFAGLQQMRVARGPLDGASLERAVADYRQSPAPGADRMAPLAVNLIHDHPGRAAWPGSGNTWTLLADTPPLHAIAVEAVWDDTRLELELDLDAERFDDDTARRFAAAVAQAVRALGDAGGQSPSNAEQFGLTPLQAAMLSASLRDGRLYHTQVCYALQGEVDHARLREAWRRVSMAHDVFRMAVRWQDVAEPCLWLAEEPPALDWRVADAAPGQTAEAALEQVLARDLAEPFRLTQPPLSRLHLVRAADGCRLLWSHHHMLFDGWSLPLVAEAVARHYAEAAAPARQAAAAPQYRELLLWYARQPDANAVWTARLEALARPCRLAPVALPAPLRGASRCFELDAAAAAALRRLARSQRTTLHTIVLAAWLLCLARLTGHAHVGCALVVAQRPLELPGMEQVLGLCINTVPVVVHADAQRAVGQFLQQVHGALLEALAHTHGSLARAQAEAARRNAIDGPLLDSMLVYENYPGTRDGVALGHAGRMQVLPSREHSSMPVVLVCLPDEAALRFELMLADRSLLARGESIERALRNVLHTLARAPAAAGPSATEAARTHEPT